MDTPFISIGIASYNYANKLNKAIEAIARQEYKDYEVVYVDDASTDESVNIIKSIIKKYPDINIRLIQNEHNQGLLKTKTRLISECRGTYIMLCDADDWMADGCLCKLVDAAVREDADRVVSGVTNINDGGKVIQHQTLPSKPSKWLWNIHHGCLYRRSILVDNNIQILYEPDDVYLITMFNMYCKKTAWIHEELYFWNVHEDSAGRNTKDIDMQKIRSGFGEMLTYLKETQQWLYKHKKNAGRDIREIEILALKLYYLQIYHSMRYLSLPKKVKGYKQLREELNSFFPDYQKHMYIRGAKNELRGYAYHIIFVSMLIEKGHLMTFALTGYHILGKLVYFDQ